MINEKFRKSGEPTFTYDWVDVEEGTGVISYYGFQTYDSIGAHYNLNNNVYITQEGNGRNHIRAESRSEGDVCFDYDFDAQEFNSPRIIKGKVHCSIPIDFKRQYTDIAYAGHIHVYFRKWDGTTETEIANATSETRTSATPSGYMNFEIDVPRTHFKIGEKMRISIVGFLHLTTTSGSHVAAIGLAFDPAGRAIAATGATSTGLLAWAANNSILKFEIPFKINI